MSEYLVIRLFDNPSHAQWMVLDSFAQNLTPFKTGALSEISIEAENRKVILVLPAIEVLTTQITLPVKNRSRAIKMLPYSLEEYIADDIENMHFALGERNDDGKTNVSIVSRHSLDNWLQQCADVGIVPNFAYSENEGIPKIPGNLVIILDDGLTFVQTDTYISFVLEEPSLINVLELLKNSSIKDESLRHLLIYTDNDGYERYKTELPELQHRTSSVDAELIADGPLSIFSSTLIQSPGCNLLQGKYAPKSNWNQWLRPWKFAACLLLALGILAILNEGGRYMVLRNQHQSISSLIESRCNSSFQISEITECQSEITRRLTSTNNSINSALEPTFLHVLSTLSGATNEEDVIEALTYRNGVMDLRIDAATATTLDELARNVSSNSSYSATIQSANPVQNRVQGRLQIVGETN